MTSRVSSTLSVVWVTKASLLGVGGLEPRDVVGVRDQMHAAVDPAHRALDLGMAGVADQDHLEALGGVALTLVVDLGDERAGGVDHLEAALAAPRLDRLGDAVRAEHRDRALRDLVDVSTKLRALALQRLDDVLVVDDLVAHVDRRPEAAQRPLDDLDRPLDPGAEAARLGKDTRSDGPGHPRLLPRDSPTWLPGGLTLSGWARRRKGNLQFLKAREACRALPQC